MYLLTLYTGLKHRSSGSLLIKLDQNALGSKTHRPLEMLVACLEMSLNLARKEPRKSLAKHCSWLVIQYTSERRSRSLPFVYIYIIKCLIFSLGSEEFACS